jgi:hypothetical protein
MSPQTFDNLALGLAMGAVLMRLLDRPWISNVLSSLTLLCATLAQRTARLRSERTQA